MSVSGNIPQKISAAATGARHISVRVSSGNYLAVLFLATFTVGLLLQLGYSNAAPVLFAIAWTIIPVIAYTDRLTFDGNVLRRRGLIAMFSRSIAGREQRLKVDEIESVVTFAVRTLRSAGRIYFRYRSEIASNGRRFTLVSGGRNYRELVRTLYPLIADAKMDVRSCELRDYLVEPQGIEVSLRLLNLASSSVLANAIDLPRRGFKAKLKTGNQSVKPQAPDIARGILMHRVANELRIAGRWRQAGEAFRRARLLIPADGKLLLEFGRFARSQANALRNMRLQRRARAALRLSAWIGREDAALTARVAESCFEFGDTERASDLFRRSLALEPQQFRAELGLAEIALRDGKLAHVIHHFASAAAIAPDPALGRFTEREIAYYSRLNDDDEYLTKELRRVGWLHNIVGARRLTTRLTAVGLGVAMFGSFLGQSVVEVGWAAATSALAAWCGLLAAGRWLSPRNTVETDD